MIATPLSKRDPIFHALMNNVGDVVHQEGVSYTSRRQGLTWLVKDGLMDPKIALIMMET